MELPSPHSWHQAGSLQHWSKHLLVPLLLLGLLLALPLPWKNPTPANTTWIDVNLQPQPSHSPELTEPINEPPIPEPLLKPKPEPLPELKTESEPGPQTVHQEAPKQTAKSPINQQPATAPTQPDASAHRQTTTAAEVMQMMRQPPSVELTEEFMPRVGPAKDFYIPEQEIMDWFADIPFLDESVDKPQLTMRFYPEGIEGQVEKFFDKITISKTFTTQYGTKIHCALIGVIAACGWR